MPKKSLNANTLSYPAELRLQEWGTCIRNSRLRQRLKALDVCERVGITHTTLRRLERGDPGAGAGLYLAVFHLLGILDQVVPSVRPELLEPAANQRVVTRYVDVFGPDIFGTGVHGDADF